MRNSAWLTGDQVAERLGWSSSKISSYELARAGLNPADVEKNCSIYTASANLSVMNCWPAPAKHAGRGGGRRTQMRCPSNTRRYRPGRRGPLGVPVTRRVVSGLLQTEEYAREAVRGRQRVDTVPATADRAFLASKGWNASRC